MLSWSSMLDWRARLDFAETMHSLRPYLSGLIDYAGLFPPAKLDMQTAVRDYAEYRGSRDRDLLGRFVLPSSRLGEFSEAASALLDHGDASVPWCLSALVTDNAPEARRAILEFNSSHLDSSDVGHALCDVVELRAADEQQIVDAAQTFPMPMCCFFEIPPEPGLERMLKVIATVDSAAKVRTGGVTPEAFPSSLALVRFIAGCHHAGVRFKATAGLHHALCGTYPFTYDTESPRGMMYGFVNLFLASAFIRKGISEGDACAILEEISINAFSFRESGVLWRKKKLTREDLRRARSELFLSFGSCSFREPVDEARALGLI